MLVHDLRIQFLKKNGLDEDTGSVFHDAAHSLAGAILHGSRDDPQLSVKSIAGEQLAETITFCLSNENPDLAVYRAVMYALRDVETILHHNGVTLDSNIVEEIRRLDKKFHTEEPVSEVARNILEDTRDDRYNLYEEIIAYVKEYKVSPEPALVPEATDISLSSEVPKESHNKIWHKILFIHDSELYGAFKMMSDRLDELPVDRSGWITDEQLSFTDVSVFENLPSSFKARYAGRPEIIDRRNAYLAAKER